MSRSGTFVRLTPFQAAGNVIHSMRKHFNQFLVCCVFLLSLLIHAEQLHAEPGILFLRLERDADGIRLMDSFARPGTLKPQPNRGSVELEVLSASGDIMHQAASADPLLERIEFPDPDSRNELRSTLKQKDRAEFTIRIPAGARTIRFFDRVGSADLHAASRRLVSEVHIPHQQPQLRASAENACVSTILSNGPPALRVNIVFLAEGYTATQQQAFTNQANFVLNQMMNVSPYKEYKSHFNAFAIFVPSAETGSDHPAEGTFRETYFSSSYGTGSLTRLITIPPHTWNSNYGDGRGKVFALLSEFLPEYDIPLLLVNDTEYGGSGGVPAIASVNSFSAELALHEIGHSFAGLGDEYEDHLPGYPEIEAPNTTRETNRDFIKWRLWISPEAPVPTPETFSYQDVVGLFEGAYFRPTGWYRPKFDCRMRNLAQPFCDVCRETHLLTIYTLLETIHGSTPADNNVTVPGGGELELRVDTVQPTPDSLVFTWTVNGATNIAFNGNNFLASFATLGTGTHLVRVNVVDATSFVRNDRLGKLSQSRSWLVRVVAPTNVPPAISEIADVVLPSGRSSEEIPFTVTDPDTSADLFSFVFVSSNTDLLSSEKIQLGGSGSARTLTLLPDPGATGASTITMIVADGTNIAERSFKLVVLAPEPELSIDPVADQVAFNGPHEVALQVTSSSAGELQFTGRSRNAAVLTDSEILFERRGEGWLTRLLPAPDVSGETTVTITVTDGVLSDSTTFNLRVLPMPVVTAVVPLVTGAGVLLRFHSEVPVAMIIERSTDLIFWTPVASDGFTTDIEYTATESRILPSGFYRVRVAPL